MAIRDLEAFIRQQMALYNPNEDLSAGSPFDVRVIQPVLRRLGVDPFTTDLSTFINDRLTQAYPDLATKEGDALTDLLNKPATLLWDPVVREIQRVIRMLSLKDPSTLTVEEAESLGANSFSSRRVGDVAKGAVRIFFTQPQGVVVSPINFVTSKTGLHFFPIATQSIRIEEMLLNVDATSGLYYFDFNSVAEKSGSAYNISADELISIAEIGSVVRVTNLQRLKFGDDEESVEDYIGRLQQELGEKSLVALRGIASKLLNSFQEINRLNVVGFNDPEMQRDVIKGGGLGPIVASGLDGEALLDLENKLRTRRFYSPSANFITSITGSEASWVLTVFGAFAGTVSVMDLTVRRVVSATELDLEEQLMVVAATGCTWTLRKKELTLSSIPGGILFPNGQNGTVAIPDDEVHVGGAYDVHLRARDFDEKTLLIDSVTDDEPLLSGYQLTVDDLFGHISLGGLVLGTDYDLTDATGQALTNAEFHAFEVQIVDGPSAGSYRILEVVQVLGFSPVLLVTPSPILVGGPYRWRLFDEINIDLVEPKETRIEGTDLVTVLGSKLVTTAASLNFNDYGAAKGDILRIFTGPDAGDYTLSAAPAGPSFDQLALTSALTHSASNLEYVLFRLNGAGGITRPLIRITGIDLLDSSKQPLGSTIPYALPVDIQSRSFQNPAHGVKYDLRDVSLGLISTTAVGGFFTNANLATLMFRVGQVGVVSVVFVGAGLSLAAAVAQINAAALASVLHIPEFAVIIDQTHFGIRPQIGGVILTHSGTGCIAFFGTTETLTTFDVNSAAVAALGGWAALSPAVDYLSRLDVLQVLDGVNAGVYEAPYLVAERIPPFFIPKVALMAGAVKNLVAYDGNGFAPELHRHVQLGSRSIGSARLFFLEPTSIEFDDDSRVLLDTGAGELRFLPDPTMAYQAIPPLPDGVVPSDGVASSGGLTFTSASQDFLRSGIRVGDQLVIETVPLGGTVVLTDPVLGLVGDSITFSLDDGPDRTLIFIRDDVSLGISDVSRQGVADQFNAAVGESIASITAANTLEFVTTRHLVIRSVVATTSALILGDVAGTAPLQPFSGADRSNASPQAGTYVISALTETVLTFAVALPLTAPWPNPLPNQVFRVLRTGVQRINATAMDANTAETGLHYFDLELLSEGTGDAWNISADLQMTAEGYRSDGYRLETADSNLSFSTQEPLSLIVSRTILENGVDDDPRNSTQVTSQAIQISYELSDLVGSVQGFLSSDVERVVCSSPLGRHLIPHFVRFDVTYSGGSKESVTAPEIENYVRTLYPVDSLEASDVQAILSRRGATSIQSPIDLIAIVHYPDRSVYAARSQNSLTTGRLAAFIPDRITVTRSLV